MWSFIFIALGFAMGHAQVPEPEFLLAIDAPVGETRIECLSGCELMGARDLGNPNAGRMTEYVYACSGQGIMRFTARAAGWRTWN